MKKIISYIAIFSAIYLQSSIYNPYTVNADDSLPSVNSDLIIPDVSIAQSGGIISTGVINQSTNFNSGGINQDTINNSQNNDTYFVVTAYYSPLPNQQHYLRGNYIDEIILNGKGIRGASGKAVFAGMLAGPKNYSFGTKIELEGVGIGEISDRGGAIVSSTGIESRGYQYDRIDVWMGFGEEGLKRSLAWGKKTVKGKILQDKSTPVSINHTNFPAPDSVVRNLVYKPHIEKATNTGELAIFDKYIGPDSNSSNIIELQNMFVTIGLYNSLNVDGKYESTKDTLIDFQVKFGIVNKRTDDGAGYFGPKTREKAKQEYIAIIQTRRIEEELQRQAQKELSQIKEIVKQKVELHISSIGNPKPGDVGKNVRNLQLTLKILGYLDIKDSAIYGDKTKFGLIKYQLDKQIIKSNKDNGAGVFGPKTKELLKNDLAIVLEKQILKQKNLVSYKK